MDRTIRSGRLTGRTTRSSSLMGNKGRHLQGMGRLLRLPLTASLATDNPDTVSALSIPRRLPLPGTTFLAVR